MLPSDTSSKPMTDIHLLIGHNYDEYNTGMFPY